MIERYYDKAGLRYYEVGEEGGDLQPLVLIHAQAVDARSFSEVAQRLSKRFHVYSLDCYGHGGSLHDPGLYNVRSLGEAVADFIRDVVIGGAAAGGAAGSRVWLLGHSSGGLVSAWVAAHTDLCERLVLEDPPLFSSQGERRRTTFNYVDLATLCHRFNSQTRHKDFVLYHFSNQYMWNFFPKPVRGVLRWLYVRAATFYRRRHPDSDLRVPFWPEVGQAAYRGMNSYDPRFGETFYDDSFHCDIPHEDLLSRIRCATVLMKARTDVSPDGILLAAMTEEDAERVAQVVRDCETVRFDCGHGIHVERPEEFLRCLLGPEPGP